MKKLLVAPLGLGVDWTAHDVPFQRSATVTPVPALLVEPPTAAQAFAEVHETVASPVDVAPLGLGISLVDQVVPFQCSAKGRGTPAPSTVRPTATQAVDEVQ